MDDQDNSDIYFFKNLALAKNRKEARIVHPNHNETSKQTNVSHEYLNMKIKNNLEAEKRKKIEIERRKTEEIDEAIKSKPKWIDYELEERLATFTDEQKEVRQHRVTARKKFEEIMSKHPEKLPISNIVDTRKRIDSSPFRYCAEGSSFSWNHIQGPSCAAKTKTVVIVSFREFKISSMKLKKTLKNSIDKL